MSTSIAKRAYPETAASACDLDSDRLFFLQHPDRRHLVRRALAAEIQRVQVLERRLKTPSPGFEVLALVQQAEGHRRRVVVEVAGLDALTVDETEAAGLFADVVGYGWTRVEYVA